MVTCSIIGSGNVASWFAYTICKHGGTIRQVYSPMLAHAEQLAATCQAEAIDNLSQLLPQSDFYLLSIKDDSYQSLLEQLPFTLPVAVHTAGSLSMNILAPYAHRYGVIYPYQTISQQSDFDRLTVPLCVEACDELTTAQLLQWAEPWSAKSTVIREEQRAYLHIAAVFASNFTNAMYGVAHEILTSRQMSFEMIMPLLEQTLEKVKTHSPAEVQTGPAIRDDQQTMEKHLDLLENEELRTIYRLISNRVKGER
jgi:Uncharacterized conserved protein